MNWLDLVIIVLLGWAVVQGFRRGFIIEAASLVALLLGIWAGAHLSDRVAAAIGLVADKAAIAFLITFLAVLLLVHLLARALTKAIDLAMLGFPNKLAGTVFGALRSAFVLSIMLNLLMGWSDGRMPSQETRDGSAWHGPLRALAPAVVPALGETKWVKEAVERLKRETQELLDR